jgi:hypothetical protein
MQSANLRRSWPPILTVAAKVPAEEKESRASNV